MLLHPHYRYLADRMDGSRGQTRAQKSDHASGYRPVPADGHAGVLFRVGLYAGSVCKGQRKDSSSEVRAMLQPRLHRTPSEENETVVLLVHNGAS